MGAGHQGGNWPQATSACLIRKGFARTHAARPWGGVFVCALGRISAQTPGEVYVPVELKFNNSEFFLTPEDIERLTGRKRYSAQARWLSDHGYKFAVNGLGMPIVATAEVNRKLVGGSTRAAEPNWDALDNYASSPRRRRRKSESL